MKRIRELVSGLTYLSETDAPIEVESPAGKPKGHPMPLAKFWAGFDEMARKYLEDYATNLRAYETALHDSRREIYVYGELEGESFALKTYAVET
jgi:hypothetical protein